ncbi:hypothetical protein ACHAW6_001882 [Cyclotella cf. meneghiniana]
MRRPTKPSPSSGYSHTSPPGQRSSHLDIPSSHDDDEAVSKGHKSKRHGASKSTVCVAALCSIIALATLIYVAKTVKSDANALFKLSRGKIAAVKNIQHKMKHHPPKQGHKDSNKLTASERFLPQQNHLLPPDSIYRTTITDIHGTSQNLMKYAGSISLVSNYVQLAALYEKYRRRGFAVLAFPSNDFHQEKDTDKEILEYVREQFPQVSFPIFSRSPLESNVVFQLCRRHTGETPGWNFHKYLVDGEGRAVKSYGHKVQPLQIEEDIVRLLEENEARATQQVPQTY